MKVFVTGGAGFIGSHIVDALIEEGNQVTVLDNLSTGYKKFVNKKAFFIEGNLMDLNKLKKYIKGHEAVIHMAANVMIDNSLDNPGEYLKKNINSAINLLEAMRLNNIKNIVFSSSAAVYGEIDDKLIKEDAKKSPLHPYGSSKLAIEAILAGYYHSFGINSVSLRYFNVYGPRDEISPVTRAVPKWIKSILHDEPITLYWQGKQIKDFIFVKDVADAHLIALKNCKGLHQYNIGSGTGILMTDVLRSILKVANKNAKIIDMGERKGDPHRLVADINKIKSELKWTPSYSLLEGIKLTFDYYKNNMNFQESFEK